jgi:hypothetical protein
MEPNHYFWEDCEECGVAVTIAVDSLLPSRSKSIEKDIITKKGRKK